MKTERLHIKNKHTLIIEGLLQVVALMDPAIIEKENTLITRKRVHCRELSYIVRSM